MGHEGTSAEAGAEGSGGRWDIQTPHEGGRPFQADAHIGFAWYGLGLATGLRFGIPLLNNGFIPSLNNAVYLNFGFDFYYIRWRPTLTGWDYGAGLGFPVTLHWEFYFSPEWSAFAEVGIQPFFHPRLLNDGDFDGGEYWFVFSVGGTYRVADMVGITVRFGLPYVVAGATIEFDG